MSSSASSSRSWLALCACALVSLAIVAIPVWLVQPFAPQTPEGLWWSHAIKRVAPAVTALALVGTVLAGWSVWRASARGRRWHRAAATIVVTVLTIGAAGAAWFARQNPFEWMFNPLPQPQFVAGAKATFVEPNDLVLAVSVDGDAAAYPIRQMAYHHLVNDRIGRMPAVVTY